MVDLGRINNKDLYSDVAEFIDYIPLWHNDPSQHELSDDSTPQDSAGIKDMPVQSSAMVNIKNIIKRTPLRKIIVSKRKRKRLREIFSDDERKRTLDLNLIIGFEDAAFLTEVFNILLDRDMSHDEFIKFYTMLKHGMPKEAMIYILCNSAEKDPNIAIQNFDNYEKAYFRYIYKQKIVNMPVLSYFIYLFTIPIRLRRIERYMIMMEINSIDRFNGEIHQIQTAEKNIIAFLKEQRK